MAAPTHWQDIQQKVFTRWCNDYLSQRGMYVEDLKTDFKNGVKLVNLLEILSAKSLGRYNKHPVINLQQMENLTLSLEFLKQEGIKLVNVGTDDLHGCNLRIILGLIWTLILRFEIKAGGGGDDKDGANDLLKWIQSKIPEYDIKNFTKDWNDGRAICALTNAMRPGLISDHKSQGVGACKKGIETADQFLGIDQLIFPDEMANPKVDKLAMMTYLAQFRNIKDEDIKENKPSDASRCQAHGPGLVEAISGELAPFYVHVPVDCAGKLEIKVEGPIGFADPNVKVVKKGEGDQYDVTYMPTTPGQYKVHVTIGGEHIPGSIFHVTVLEKVSLGGEGCLLVFFSTTSSSDKSRSDRYNLERLFAAKKTHLREDFSPWIPVDLMDRGEREAVFTRAGTRNLPIVFIDDDYVGDYDACQTMEEKGELDKKLNMSNKKLISESDHINRLKAVGVSEVKDAGPKPAAAVVQAAAPAAPAAAASAPPAAAGAKPAFCVECGEKTGGVKFCPGCGKKQ